MSNDSKRRESHTYRTVEGSTVHLPKWTRDELRLAWLKASPYGPKHTYRERVPDEETALRLTALLCRRVYNDPACAGYDPQTRELTFSCMDAPSMSRASDVSAAYWRAGLDEAGELFARQDV